MIEEEEEEEDDDDDDGGGGGGDGGDDDDDDYDDDLLSKKKTTQSCGLLMQFPPSNFQPTFPQPSTCRTTRVSNSSSFLGGSKICIHQTCIFKNQVVRDQR